MARSAAREAEAAWREVVRRTLSGFDPEKAAARTDDGFVVPPVHFRHHAPWTEGMPGSGAWLRGARAAGTLPRGWAVVQAVREPVPEEARAALREELAGGGDGVWLHLDRSVDAEATPTGVVWTSAADVARTLGDPADLRGSLFVEAGWRASEAAARLLAWRGANRNPRFHFGADPLAARARGEPVDPEAEYDRLAGLVTRIETAGSGDRVLVADGTVAHDAGASTAEMLALTVAAVAEHLRALATRGVAVATVLARTGLRVAVDADVFEAAAALRAARRLWRSLAAAAGAGEVRPHLHAVAARRMYTRYDPWTNLLRGTAATLAAAVGGADALTVWPLDHALGLPDPQARRIARNTQLVAKLEARLHRVIDAAGGSPWVKRLADLLARRAWELFREIEGRGGLAAALADGWLAGRIAATAAAREARIRRRRQVIVGVSDFADPGERRPRIRRPDPGAVTARRRTAAEGARALPRDFAALEARVEAGATFRPDAEAPAAVLPPRPLAAPFERLRDLAEARRARGESLPRVAVFGLGRPRDYVDRAGFARHLFAAGGFPGEEIAPVHAPEEAAARLVEGGFALAVLTGADARLADGAAAFAERLRAAGARRVFAVSGAAVAGVDATLARDMDAAAFLAELWTLFGERLG